MKPLNVVSLAVTLAALSGLSAAPAGAAEASSSSASSGAASAEVKPADTTTAAASSSAKKKDVSVEVGLAVGLVAGTSGFGLGPGVGLDTGAAFRLGPGALGVHLRTQYQQQSKDGTIELPCSAPPSSPCIQGTKMDWKVREQALDFALRVSYRFFEPEHSWTPFIGVGPKMYLLKATTTSFGLDNTETDTRFGFVAFGGAQANLGPGHVFGEVEFQRAGLRHKITGDGSLSSLGFNLGYRFAF